jgi:hypothetical protein
LTHKRSDRSEPYATNDNNAGASADQVSIRSPAGAEGVAQVAALRHYPVDVA